ncbi:DUF2891 domain-containing protein [Acetobacter persici]|uniref:DUF2891 domain-containing protein n=1 Tax=Acetobacter persici TaxID=1076596 RepID=UPI0039EB318A
MTFDQTTAARFARIALGHVSRPFPYFPGHCILNEEDRPLPQESHPIFYGSFDWHSCVHGYWMLATLIKSFPDLEAKDDIIALFRKHVTTQNVEIEQSYFENSLRRSFERPYGWGWLLKLVTELHAHPYLSEFADVLAPLAEKIAALYRDFLPLAVYPIRVGTHFNSAFSLRLTLDYAETFQDEELAGLVRGRANDWFGNDEACQAWEPCGDEFLSSALMEAALMARVLDSTAFQDWFGRFLPRIMEGKPATLFTPAMVSTRTDGKIAHLDGLNLSRVWCWREILAALRPDEAFKALIERACKAHLDASLPHIVGDYMGEHWLATFAVLALRGA